MEVKSYIPILSFSDLKEVLPVNTVRSDSNRGKLIKEGSCYPLNLQPQKYITAFQEKYCEGMPFELYYKSREKKVFDVAINLHLNKDSILYESILLAHTEGFKGFTNEFRSLGFNFKKSVDYAKKKAEWIAIVEIVKSRNIKKAHEIYSKFRISQSLKFIKSYDKFRVAYNRVYDGKNVNVIHARLGKESPNKKLTTLHVKMMEEYAAHPKKYTFGVIAELVNHEALQHGLKPISESLVRNYIKQPEIWNRILFYRDNKKFKDTVAPYLRRDKANNSCDQWQIDASPMQFYCKDENNKLIRLSIFVIYDVHSGKIVGFDISKTEDFYNFNTALYNSVKSTKFLPFEIVSDNASWTKRDEFRALEIKLNQLGVTFRKAKVKNAKDKGNIERFFHTFNTSFERYMDGHIGDGITAKRENSRIDQEHLQKVTRYNNYPSIDEAKKQIIQLVSQYNELESKGKKAPSKVFIECSKPNGIKVEPEQFSLLFWNEREVKVTRSSLTIIVSKTKFEFDPFDNETRLDMTGKTVRVRYDDKDMRSVFVFDLKTDSFIGEWKLCSRFNQALANQTEKDKHSIITGEAHNKAIETVIKKRASKLRNEVVNQFGKDIEQIDPFSFRKELVNSKEDSELMSLYQLHGIDQNSVIDRPQYIVKNEYNTDVKIRENNRLHSKKFEKQTEFPVFSPEDKSDIE